MPPAAPRNRRVLVVDDNTAIHEDLRKVLCGPSVQTPGLSELEADLFGEAPTPPKDAFTLTSAYQGQDAAKLVATALARNEPFAMAFVDVRMPPGWDGVKTVEELWRLDPSLQIAICTAYSDYSWAGINARLGDNDGLVILKKPFDDIEVQQLASSLTRRWDKAHAPSTSGVPLAPVADLPPLHYEAKANVAENYLFIAHRGRMTEAEASAFSARCIVEMRRLQPGFGIINDLGDARPSSEEVADQFARAQAIADSLGVSRVVRIVGPGAGAASLQLSRKVREAKLSYPVHIASSLEEALRILREPH